jgi:hypothetical protein
LSRLLWSPKTEKAWAVPVRSSYCARDRRKAGIGLLPPLESVWHDCNGVALPVILPDQHRASFEPPTEFARFFSACEPVEKFYRFPIEAAQSFLLDAVSDHVAKNALGQAFGWRDAERETPPRAKGVDAEGFYFVDLGLDHSGINIPLIHSYAAFGSEGAAPRDLPLDGLATVTRYTR